MKRSKANNALIVLDKPRSIISEKFKSIRTNIMFSVANENLQVVTFTSEKANAGKSTVSANVAITCAQAGYKTLLIDGDMRKPTQHYLFNTSNLNLSIINLRLPRIAKILNTSNKNNIKIEYIIPDTAKPFLFNLSTFFTM